MQEVEVTILDGDTVIVSDVSVFVDTVDLGVGEPDGSGWHAHAMLSLGVVLHAGEQLRLQTADGKSADVVVVGSPTIEGGEALYVFTGVGPLSGLIG